MTKGALAGLAAGLLLLPSTALAVSPSWWGGEVVAVQDPDPKTGFGYGRYEIKMVPSTGKGSITGFFNLCYADSSYSNCIAWNPSDSYHLEVDVLEFTPTGNNPGQRRWIETCLTDDDCQVTNPNPAPRVGDSLKGVSFNTFPSDNQVYAYTDFDPYAEPHTYSTLVLPNRMVWEVDGANVLTRNRNADKRVRQFNNNAYQNFDRLLRGGQVSMVINLWDGSQGGNGGFGGPSSVQQDSGQPARVLRVAYYPATCKGDDCDVAEEPTFLTDFEAQRFIKNGVEQDIGAGRNICDTNRGNKTFWQQITRTDYPVYVSPGNVTCSPTDGLTLYFTKNRR